VTVYLQDPDVTLYHGDALETLKRLPDESVHCCVTSPPYSDARSDIACVPPEKFPEWLTVALHDAQRVLAPTGSLMVNLGRRFREGIELDYAAETLRLLRADAWLKIDELIWFKPNANGTGGPYLRNCHEYVWWLALSPNAYRGYDEARRPYRDLSRYERGYTQAVKGEPRDLHRRIPHPLGAKPESVIVCSVGKEKGRAHPTPMPLELAEDLVKLACPPGGTVLDPFMGEGTTGRAARKLGRQFIGIDIEERWCAEAASRLQQLRLEFA
jgi:site-specific DNA-methyltransferase (adenine-specific)